jgi:hypothetical protein
MKWKLYSLAALAMIFSSGCGLLNPKPPEMTRTIDHKSPQPTFENAELWKKVQDAPATFHPRPLPSGSTISPETGDWVIDPQDQAAFFVPSKKCGDLTPAMWRAEALKGINLTKKEQTSNNTAKVLFGWPAYLGLAGLNALPPADEFYP